MLKKLHLLRGAWKDRGIYKMTQLHPLVHFLYLLKYGVCVLLGRYSKDGCGELIWRTDFYPVYTVAFDPPEPAWDEHFVGRGFGNWSYSDEIGIR